jgi:uncharacterized membrane protein YciS (DUF1049 family)
MSQILQNITIYVVPALILLAFLFLCGFVMTERIIVILRLRRKEHRKEIIRRWKRQRRLQKAAYAKIKKQLGGDR